MVAPISPMFTWQDGKLRSPQEVDRERKVAEALMFAKPQATGFWGALGQVGSSLSGSLMDSRADAYTEQGREAASNLFSGIGSGSSADAISAALLNPAAEWATPQQSGIAEALFNNELRQSDPAYQLDLAYKQAQIDQLNAPQPVDPTSAIQNYEYLIGRGVDPAQAETMAFGAAGTTINNMGNIPAGYEVFQDPTSGSTQMRAIPGGPAALAEEAAAAEQQALAAKGENASGRKDLATEIITGAANKARTALTSGGMTTGVGGAVAGVFPESQAAELRRQIDVLKANATIENLTAMRQASPTGGALGSVTEKEGAMLAAASGAIDPNATFEQVSAAIDNYERTLLQVVHGPVEGERIFLETRKQPVAGTGGDVDSILQKYGVQ